MSKIACWILGFGILFSVNVLVEQILLPRWGLDNTEKNDIYFQCWCVVVGLWFIFGLKISGRWVSGDDSSKRGEPSTQ